MSSPGGLLELFGKLCICTAIPAFFTSQLAICLNLVVSATTTTNNNNNYKPFLLWTLLPVFGAMHLYAVFVVFRKEVLLNSYVLRTLNYWLGDELYDDRVMEVLRERAAEAADLRTDVDVSGYEFSGRLRWGGPAGLHQQQQVWTVEDAKAEVREREREVRRLLAEKAEKARRGEVGVSEQVEAEVEVHEKGGDEVEETRENDRNGVELA